LSLLAFLESQEKGLVSFLPGGAGAGVGAAAGGGGAAAAVVVLVVAAAADGELLIGDGGTGVVILLLFREVVLLSWSFSEGLAGSEETISMCKQKRKKEKKRYKTVRERCTLVLWGSIIIQIDNVKI
jgi:hypothetical protein